MPLRRLKKEYLEEDGVHFLMEDEAGGTVACRVSHEALRELMSTACTFQEQTALFSTPTGS